MTVVQKSIDESTRERIIATKDLAPFSEALIAGDDRRSVFVALADELEEPGCRSFFELDVAEFVDDEQRNSVEMSLFVARNAVELCGMDLVEQVLRREEVGAVASA